MSHESEHARPSEGPRSQGLSEAQQRALSANCPSRAYDKGRIILERDDPGDAVLLIQRGRCRAKLQTAEGRELIYRDLGAGDLFGEIAAIDGRPRSAEIVALTECLITSIPRERFMQLLRESGETMEWLLRRMAGLIRDLTDRQMALATQPLRDRLQAFIAVLARKAPQSGSWANIDLPSHEELAGLLGSHREMVTRALRELEKGGFIHRTRNGPTRVRTDRPECGAD